MRFDISRIQRALLAQKMQQAVKQDGISAARQRQVQIGDVATDGAARVDHYDFQGRIGFLGRAYSLETDRVTPRGIRANQYDHLGLFEILITARHGIGAEGAFMPGDRRRHAQAAVGIHIAAADKAFHQLVGDIIIFGQQLPGAVNRHRIRAVFIDNADKGIGHQIQRFRPAGFAPVDFGLQQPAFEFDGFAERRAFRAKPPEISRMRSVAADFKAMMRVIDLRADSAAYAAIGASGLYRFIH